MKKYSVGIKVKVHDYGGSARTYRFWKSKEAESHYSAVEEVVNIFLEELKNDVKEGERK